MVRQDFWDGLRPPGVRSTGVIYYNDGGHRNTPTVQNRYRALSQMSVWCRTIRSVTDTARSTAQGRIDIAVSKKKQKNKKDTSTLLTNFL